MPQRLLVTLDQSRFSEFALARAASLVRAGDRVTLATVVDTLPDYPEYAEPLRKGVAAYHDEVRKLYFGPDVDVRSEVIRGRPDTELITLLRQIEYDLVVAATHGRGPFNRLWLGSVAHALVRQAHIPVLLVRPDEETEPVAGVDARIRSVSVPLDGSRSAEAALQALPLIRLPEDGSVHLVRVVVPPDVLPPAYVPVPRSDDDLLEQHRKAAKDYLCRTAKGLSEKGYDVDVEVPFSSSIATAIVDTAQRAGCDAIAITTHGRGGLARALLGSVSDKVMRASTLPVLMVPAPPDVP